MTRRVSRWCDEQQATGQARGGQVLVAEAGEVVADEVFGTRHRDGLPMTRDTRMLLFSASKPLVAVAVHQLVERGLVAYDAPVADYLPAFAAHGKGTATVRHAFLHQLGIPDLERRVPLSSYRELGTSVPAICELPLELAPGAAVAYHPLTSFTLLAGVVEAVTGTPFREHCREHVFAPAGMAATAWGVPGAPGPVDDTLGSDPVWEAEIAAWRAASDEGYLLPAGNAFGQAGDLMRFYLALLDGRLVSAPTLQEATRLQAPFSRHGTFGFGLGFMVGCDPAQPASRGTQCGPAAYGHPGMCSVQAIVAPTSGRVLVAVVNTALPQEQSDARFAALCTEVFS